MAGEPLDLAAASAGLQPSPMSAAWVDEVLGVMERARAEAEALRLETRQRTLHDPVAYAVLVLVQRACTESVRATNNVRDVWAAQLDATSALLSLIERARVGEL